MTAPEQFDVRCPNCGQTFKVFLQQMAEHNRKVVCPRCGQEHDPAVTGLRAGDKAQRSSNKSKS